ncbi:MAG: hypothetical protein KGL48_02215 [Sphingomonadales bacterium]|nr:hypothetical protein [Sphingomonadales bacterium]MDE2569365.1 hypothetical protein [Sphingomonadales bacterium]
MAPGPPGRRPCRRDGLDLNLAALAFAVALVLARLGLRAGLGGARASTFFCLANEVLGRLVVPPPVRW